MVVIFPVGSLILRHSDEGSLVAAFRGIGDVFQAVQRDTIYFGIETIAAFPVLPGRDFQDLYFVIGTDLFLFFFFRDSNNNYSFRYF